MTNSVVMSVYNGQKYIKEQMDSLLEQTRILDEIIIIDDCSTDNTVEILKNYIEEHDCFNIRLIQNNENYGWQKNFFEGMKMATSDVIFPCDQDDIWHKDKVEKMSKILEDNPQIMVLEGQPHKFFDESENSDKKSLHVKLGSLLEKKENDKDICKNTEEITQKKFDTRFMRRAPGCALAVRKKFFNTVAREWFDGMPHDELVTNYAIVLGKYYVYDYEVIEWRRHVGSASNPQSRNRKRRIQEILLDKKLITGLLNYGKKNHIPEEYLGILIDSSEWNESRYQLVIKRRFEYIVKVLKYKRFYYQKRRILTDVKYAFQRDK